MIFARTRGWIGIDLGTHAVKLAQVERRGGRLQLVDAIAIRRSEAWPAGDEEPLSSSNEIRAALSLGGNFAGRDAAVTLPMAVCDVRACTIPAAADADTKRAILHELDTVYGDTEATRDYDFWTTSAADDEETQNAIAMSIPSFWTSRVARDLTESRLIGNVLDGLPLAMARAVTLGTANSSSAQTAGPVAALDWGYHRATLCTVEGGRPRFVRTLRNAGFESIVTAVRQRLEVTAEEAQKLLWEHGLPSKATGAGSELQEVLEEVTHDAMGSFLDELSKTIGFLQGQRRELAPHRLILFGGGATVRNIAEFLAERVELPAETWRLGGTEPQVPAALLGPAIALSSLAWSAG